MTRDMTTEYFTHPGAALDRSVELTRQGFYVSRYFSHQMQTWVVTWS